MKQSFSTVNKIKQKEKINVKPLQPKELKNLDTKNGNMRLISTSIFDVYTNYQLAKNKINLGEVILLYEGRATDLKYHNRSKIS